jgi:uncharacterized protein (DUF1499 family)
MGYFEPDPAAARLNRDSAGRPTDPSRRRRAVVLGLPFIIMLSTGCAGAPMRWFEGSRPDRLGVSKGQLQPVDRSKRNAVSSTAEPPHRIAPFSTGPDPRTDLARLAALLAANPRVKIIAQDNEYIQAEFRSRWLGFVDDVEFLLVPAERLIHVRSASRLGYSDLGVNRARIESIRAALAATAQ